MPHEKLYPQFTLTEEKIEELKSILPEAFADGKINWESLRESLGEFLEEDEQDTEHFGLFWPGKRDAKKIAATPSTGTLIPVKGEGVNVKNTKNIFIEGENLKVLKILLKSYANSIKMMYFDPPYNTGNDFIYEDDFTETIDEYLRRTGQTDEEGKPMTTNKKSDGRFHSKWLSMMYPRLKLARNLLSEDGAIFISIDDNEFYNLRELMNEIFGEENFLGNFIRQSKIGGGSDTKFIAKEHEYILCFSKNYDLAKEFFEDHSTEYLKRYKEKDEIGNYFWDTFARPGLKNPIYYNIIAPNGEKIYNGWIRSEKRFKEDYKKGEIRIFKKSDNDWSVQFKQRLNLKGKKPRSLMENLGGTIDGKNEILELFNNDRIFSYPKSSKLISYLINIYSDKEDTILDIFAGSGTTAQAILELNQQDKGNRKFILVQMPEKTDEETEAYKAGYKNIAEICKERIRRVIKKIDSEKNENNSDRGFKVFKLNKSNYKGWQNYEGEDINKLETLFESFESPLIDNWKKENLVNEIVLLEGFPLDSTIEKIKEFKDNEVNKVTTDFHEHKLLICLDQKIKKSTIKNLNLNEKDVFICLDSSITDEEKMTLSDKGLIKTI